MTHFLGRPSTPQIPPEVHRSATRHLAPRTPQGPRARPVLEAGLSLPVQRSRHGSWPPPQVSRTHSPVSPSDPCGGERVALGGGGKCVKNASHRSTPSPAKSISLSEPSLSLLRWSSTFSPFSTQPTVAAARQQFDHLTHQPIRALYQVTLITLLTFFSLVTLHRSANSSSLTSSRIRPAFWAGPDLISFLSTATRGLP